MDDRVIMCDTHIWTETDLESYVRNYYVHRQVRAVSRWRVPIQTRFEIFKYLIKKKIPVYGWQGDYVWYPHMNRNWFGVICKELLCPWWRYHKLEPFMDDWLCVIPTYEQKLIWSHM